MGFGINVETWGPYALFSRPELKTERMSYDIITPSAARGLLEAIYWHPDVKVIIDRVYLLPPFGMDSVKPNEAIRFTNIRRNEVSNKISASTVKAQIGKGYVDSVDAAQMIQQRAAMVLQDVHYVIAAHYEIQGEETLNKNIGKVLDIVRRRLERGQCFSQPYFGCREFTAFFRQWEDANIPAVDLSTDFGLMLYDFDYKKDGITPTYFRAKLDHGVMQVSGVEVLR